MPWGGCHATSRVRPAQRAGLAPDAATMERLKRLVAAVDVCMAAKADDDPGSDAEPASAAAAPPPLTRTASGAAAPSSRTPGGAAAPSSSARAAPASAPAPVVDLTLSSSDDEGAGRRAALKRRRVPGGEGPGGGGSAGGRTQPPVISLLDDAPPAASRGPSAHAQEQLLQLWQDVSKERQDGGHGTGKAQVGQGGKAGSAQAEAPAPVLPPPRWPAGLPRPAPASPERGEGGGFTCPVCMSRSEDLSATTCG